MSGASATTAPGGARSGAASATPDQASGAVSVSRAQVSRALAALRPTFRGHLHTPDDPRYEALRLPWNRNLDPRPALVAEPADVADVVAAVRVAREHGLPFAPQATGHGTVLPCDGGLLLNTASMATVRVDASRRLARTDPGALLGDVVAAAEPAQLTPVAGHASVGITGFTLGGGVGWLSRRFGLGADNLLRAQVVTGAGRVIWASREEHPDLFWALRGGGGNFGVVTALEVRLHQVTHGYGGWLAYPIDVAAQVLRRYRHWAQVAADLVSVGMVLTRLPAGPQFPERLWGRPVLAVRGLHLGTPPQARAALRPLLGDAGRPLVGGFQWTPVAALAQARSAPAALLRHGDLFDDLPDEVAEAVIEVVESADGAESPTVEIRQWGGTISRPEDRPGPGHRDVGFSVTVDVPAGEPTGADLLARVARRFRRYATGGSFLNFLTDPAAVDTAFPAADRRRLAEVKHRYDPDNFFRLNHNIRPSAPADDPAEG